MIDNHGFSFIYDVQNETDCAESSKYLNLLKIPDGYTVNKKFLQGNMTITQGYNAAMRLSPAKYKIYLNHSTAIINRNFLYQILSIFENHPKLGMLGVLGAKKLPPNGNWREATERYGQIFYFGKPFVYNNHIILDYEQVQAVDGMIMITQYDLPWREDLFQDQFFYDTAQCLEFTKAGYTVGIPKQSEPWCSNNNFSDTLILFYLDRDLFLNEYQKFLN